MKKTIVLIALFSLMPFVGAQNGEKLLNRRYLNEIRDSLSQVVQGRQKAMQRYAERWLSNLPNDEKLYDESYISLSLDLLDTFYENGQMRLDLVYRLSYNCKHLEGWTDDYPLGTFDVDSSNSCRAICRLTKTFLEDNLSDMIRGSQEIETIISSTADGTEFTMAIPYDGRYGEFRYCPVVFNGERLRISVERSTGISNNCQLAYIRAQAVKAWLEENIHSLQAPEKIYRFVTQSYKDSVHTHYYRRSSIEMRVTDVFRETVDRMQAARMQDDYVDFNIPLTNRRSPNTYALIIANEEYDNALIPDVPFAHNDALADSLYFVRALGVPHRQVKVLRNASRATIEQEGIHWLKDLANATATAQSDQKVPTADFIICYAGHGYTDLDGKAYLLPNNINAEDIDALQPNKDGGCKLFCKKKKAQKQPLVLKDEDYDIVLSKKESRRLAEQCLSVEDLCAAFNSKTVPVRNLTVVIDASFDGHDRYGRPIVRVERKESDKKKRRKASLRTDAMVMLAAEYDKTAFAFTAQEHGFLTYFLLMEIKQQKDNFFNLTYQDIYETVERKLNKESALQNKWQEISGIAGGRYKDDWRGLKLINK